MKRMKKNQKEYIKEAKSSWRVKGKGNISRGNKNTCIQNRVLDSVGEGEGGMFRENSMETCILSRVKQITSPGWMHETSAQAWCTGKTHRVRGEREAGGGIEHM